MTELVNDIIDLIVEKYSDVVMQTVWSFVCRRYTKYRKIKKIHFYGMCRGYHHLIKWFEDNFRFTKWFENHFDEIKMSINPSKLSYLDISKEKNEESTSDLIFSPISAINVRNYGISTVEGATILYGEDNMAYGNNSIILCGKRCNARGNYSTVIGGNNNNANAAYSTIMNGIENESNGFLSTIFNGYGCTADGSYSFVSGYKANAYMCGSKAYSIDGDETQKLTVQIKLHNGYFKLYDRTYPYLKHDGAALIKANLIGVNGTSAIFNFVVMKRKTQHLIKHFNPDEIICTNDKGNYQPIAIEQGFTIKVQQSDERMTGVLKMITIHI